MILPKGAALRVRIKARLFLPDRLDEPSPVLTGSEAHYLKKVLHSAVGDGVILFGRGESESVYRIEDIHEDRVYLSLRESREIETESPVELSLVVAVGKGKKLEEIVESATALGVKRIVPFVARHSVAKRSNPRLQERLEIIARESCRQCRRTTLPRIEPVQPDLKRAVEALSPKRGVWVVLDEAGGESPRAVTGREDPRSPWVLFCGPEGGWHEKEREMLQQLGSVSVSLGPRILRTELAAVVAVGVFESLLSDSVL